jgi:signal transduction histidine kinase/predicted  nucleic acid-binding Zn-ribbon protein
MSVLQAILNLLTTSPGGMVYYLVLLFSIWAVVGLALSRWARGERRGAVPRLLVAGALMSCGRLAFFVLALLDRSSSLQPISYLILLAPPLERFLDTMSMLLICWAMAIPPQKRTFGRAFIGLTAFLATGLYLIMAMQWGTAIQGNAGALYNLSGQGWIWELGQLAILTGALAYLLAVPVSERGTLMVALGVLAVGHLLQAVFPYADEIPHFAGWVRFANLLAYPVLAVTAFRLIMNRFDVQAANLQTVNQESLAQITGLMDLLDTNQKMTASLHLDAVLENAVRSVSHALQSNLCGLVFVGPENGKSIELPIQYRAPETVTNQRTLQTADYPAIQHAITRNKPVVFGPGESSHAAQVYQLLGSEQPGPLIVQPLENEDSVIGAILVCQPGQSMPFTPVQIRKCETLARPIALAVENARAYQKMQGHVSEQTDALRTLETEHARTKADLENRLKQSQDEIAIYVQKLYETELAEQRSQNDARDLRQTLSKVKTIQDKANEMQAGLKHSMAQVAQLTQKVATLDQARAELERQTERLEGEKRDLQTRLAEAEATYKSLTSHTRQLQRTLDKSSQSQAGGLSTVALQTIPCGVVVCNVQGQMLEMNSAAEMMLGYGGDEWRGQKATLLWSDDEWQSAAHAVTDQYTTQTSLLEPFLVQRLAQGFQAALSPLRVEERHVGAVITLHSIQQGDESTRARDEFLASLAQELRTPMTSILGYTDLLMSESVGQLEGIQRKFLQRVQANIERMGSMLNDMIGVTAIDSGKLVIELEPVDIVRVVETALRKVQFRLEERELATHLEIGDLVAIYADPDLVQQMVDNLLTNACKSSAAGTTINILAHRETDDIGKAYLHIAVSDTGGGIAPEDRTRVFERFYRADNALVAGLGETGVGLAIVKALVEAHQGHIWIETTMGEGTTFHFTLPYGLEKVMGDGVNNRVVAQHRPGGASPNG